MLKDLSVLLLFRAPLGICSHVGYSLAKGGLLPPPILDPPPFLPSASLGVSPSPPPR